MFESTFTTECGTELFYRAWLPENRPQGAVVLFHRGHEIEGFGDLQVQARGLQRLELLVGYLRIVIEL